MRRLKLCAAAAGALVFACTPALNWREVRPEGSGATAMFPCKPTAQTRRTSLAGAAVSMTLVACSADGATFALGHAELGDPSRVGAALIDLRSALAANLDASDLRTTALDVPGMTPNPQAQRIWLVGQLPDGTPAQEQAAIFARATRVYQAVVIGGHVDDAAAGVFFEGLRLAP